MQIFFTCHFYFIFMYWAFNILDMYVELKQKFIKMYIVKTYRINVCSNAESLKHIEIISIIEKTILTIMYHMYYNIFNVFNKT
jgi:hypothetical protein